MNDLNRIYNKVNEISRLTDSLRYSLEPWSHAGLRGTRGRCPGECIDRYALVLEDLDNIEHDILCIRSYLKSEVMRNETRSNGFKRST